jgi:hypothetical protein
LFSQAITVDNTTNSPAQLVDLLLGNSCVEVSNISVSSTQSVAYFNQNGSTFPISEGIIIRNGVATFTQGQYTGANLSSSVTNSGDAFLQNLSDNNGGSSPIVNVEYLEFDFIPSGDTLVFKYLFGSEEYPEFSPSSFNDAFGLFLWGPGISGPHLLAGYPNGGANIATIPGGIPVTINNVGDESNTQYYVFNEIPSG